MFDNAAAFGDHDKNEKAPKKKQCEYFPQNYLRSTMTAKELSKWRHKQRLNRRNIRRAKARAAVAQLESRVSELKAVNKNLPFASASDATDEDEAEMKFLKFDEKMNMKGVIDCAEEEAEDHRPKGEGTALSFAKSEMKVEADDWKMLEQGLLATNGETTTIRSEPTSSQNYLKRFEHSSSADKKFEGLDELDGIIDGSDSPL